LCTRTLDFVSTRGSETSASSKLSGGNGRKWHCSEAMAWPTVISRPGSRRSRSVMQHPSRYSLAASQEETDGTGVSHCRRKRPFSPSTPPFSWLPSMPGVVKEASNR